MVGRRGHNQSVNARRHTTLIAVALTVGAALAVYPSSEPGAAGFWWLLDMALLALSVRGRRWANNLLTYTTAFGALLFLAAGAAQLTTDARYFGRGIALTVAALLLLDTRRQEPVNAA
jgi:hypothetical protein